MSRSFSPLGSLLLKHPFNVEGLDVLSASPNMAVLSFVWMSYSIPLASVGLLQLSASCRDLTLYVPLDQSLSCLREQT